MKWLENSPFDQHDLATLHRHRAVLTPSPVPLIAITRTKTNCTGLDAEYGPEQLLTAWSS